MTSQIEIIRTYKTSNGIVGAVYTYMGRKCSTFLGRVKDAAKALASSLGIDSRSREDRIIELGSLWENYGKRRVYFNDLEDRVFTALERYNTGNVSYAELDGEKISNSRAKKIMGDLAWGKFWYDLDDGEFHAKGIHEDHVGRIAESIEAEIA